MSTECLTNPGHYEKQVEELVNSHHERNSDDNLLVAVWYDKSNKRGDINLLEVYGSFPFAGQGELETFEFPSTDEFLLKGRLKIVITSPEELRLAMQNDDRILRKVRNAKDKQAFFFSDEGKSIYKEALNGNA